LPKTGAAFADLNLDAFAEEAAPRADTVPSDAMRFESFVQEAVQITGVSLQPAPPAPAAPSAEPEALLWQPPAPAATSASFVAEPPAAAAAPVEAAAPAPASAATSAAASALAALSLEALPEIESQAEPQAEPQGFQDAADAIEISFDTFVFDDALQSDAPLGDGLLVIEEDFAREAPAFAAPSQAQAASGDDAFVEAASEIEPIRFDDDAFFLEELSAEAGKARSVDVSPVFEFDSIPAFDAPAPAPAERREFDLDVVDLSFEDIPAESSPPPAAAKNEPASVSLDSFGSLSLVDNDAPLSPPPPRQDTFKHDLSALESRISSLSLVEIEPSEPETAAPPFASEFAAAPEIGAHTPAPPAAGASAVGMPGPAAPKEMHADTAASMAPPPLPTSVAAWPMAETATSAPPVSSPPHPASRGIVLIEAGLGGPDPVRQVLAGLPASFPMPVLVRLHLQGGRYDRLVTQMERAASLAVMLAEAGQMVRSGCIYFLPDGVGLLARADGMQFIAHPSPAATIFAALPAEDSAVIFLSGSDSALIEDAMQAADAGALLIAQSPEDCYDGAACAYLRSRGAPSALPGELARRLLSRWG
jgi:hypothetical protein